MKQVTDTMAGLRTAVDRGLQKAVDRGLQRAVDRGLPALRMTVDH